MIKELKILHIYNVLPYKSQIALLLKEHSNLTGKERKEVLSNQKLTRYYKLFLRPRSEQKFETRAKYKLFTYQNVKKHILMQDPSGKTKGCGCMYCVTKHLEYKYTKEYNLHRTTKKRLEIMENVLNQQSTINNEVFDRFGKTLRKYKAKVQTPIKNIKGEVLYSSILTVKEIKDPLQMQRRIAHKLFECEGKLIDSEKKMKDIIAFRKLLQTKLF